MFFSKWGFPSFYLADALVYRKTGWMLRIVYFYTVLCFLTSSNYSEHFSAALLNIQFFFLKLGPQKSGFFFYFI